MAPPDLNSVPPSTTPNAPPMASRRASQMTGTPLLPNVTSSGFYQQDETGVPIRHPRPLTAAELHLQVEKEQEAVVNRLARELSDLRALHSASVASNASSSNTSAVDHPLQASTDFQAPHQARRRHRSSSSLSTRSITGLTFPPGTTTSQASVERARDAVGMRSRENSLAGVGLPLLSRSRAPSASPSPRITHADTQQHVQLARFEDLERAKASLELARKENEMLAARIRELEGLLRQKDVAGDTARSNAS